MKKMLVPVDFSAASSNAVDYATHWAMDNDYDTMILLHTLSDGIFDKLIPSAEYSNVGTEYLVKERGEAKRQMQELYSGIIKPLAPGISVQLAMAEEQFLRSMLTVIETEKPELVVAGTGGEGLNASGLVSDNVISIARVSPVRVLIVPAGYRYHPVHSALVPVDFRFVDSLGKIAAYNTSSQAWKERKLMVLNVSNEPRAEEERNQTELALHEYLKYFNHSIFYVERKNIISGILHFAAENDVELIIALPRTHSFLYNLTHKSISEAIYKSAIRPVLILK